jgi:hypothetical protein
VVVQAKFREIAKTITTPGFLVFLAISRTPKKMGSGKYVVIIKLGTTTRIIMMNKIPDSTNMII